MKIHQMTVGELKRKLASIKDDVIIVIKPHNEEDEYSYVCNANFQHAGQINNDEFVLYQGEFFGY